MPIYENWQSNLLAQRNVLKWSRGGNCSAQIITWNITEKIKEQDIKKSKNKVDCQMEHWYGVIEH